MQSCQLQQTPWPPGLALVLGATETRVDHNYIVILEL
jgi:hypothetical protein